MTASQPKSWTIAGWVLSGLVSAFLAFDVVIKLPPLAIVTETMTGLGYPAHLSRTIGIIELVSLALYLFPRTAVLGAVLWTGVLGGAIATHMRVESPLFSHTLFGIYLGLFLWGGLFLRIPELRRVFPLRG